ncbi:SAM-dependent methyltransferase [Henriciella algicola]|uniref:S-adenosylmethionine-dependent methyltransferase n=1 Tax=Henriciella algicola TaxID=1608422 RepID=A0A399RQH3_9PROT|nr:SAM-dependent methyltransferase [Henriciella algicola]RIJ32102.1 S-adenosylmethionine-dependent methyltransferase [Henriciella algicola]
MTQRNIGIYPIGTVRSKRSEPIDDGWDAIPAHIEVDAERFTPEALFGLDTFSHAEIIFLFDRVPDEKIERSARHPRGNKDWPLTGIFAQRGKNRPNRIGVTVCRVLKVEGLTLYLEGLDAIDGTPVLDIKPVMEGFLPRGDIREPDWSKALMAGYWD